MRGGGGGRNKAWDRQPCSHKLQSDPLGSGFKKGGKFFHTSRADN